ncbi:uncharacterized protein LOC135307232 [Passer domesticus]|uniref:uncharacterized protein LOC135307232 n=1 Tax=Passer domesticus TaxID=48849 RepID=UPI0030FEA56C
MSRTEPLGDAEGHKKPHEPAIVKMQVLKEMQQEGQAMDQKAVLKVAFPGVSGGSLEGPAGRKAMPDTGTGTADEVSGKASPLTWLHKVLVLSEPPSGVSAGRTSPAPLLIRTQKPSSHHRNPTRGKNKGKGHQKPHEPSKNMRQMLKELLQAGQVDGEAGQKVAFPEGSSGSMPASVAGREVMPGTGRGDWDRDMDSMLVFLDESLKTSADSRANPAGETDLASQPTFRNEPLGGSEGVSAGRTFPGPLVDVARRPSSHRRGLLRLENKLRGESKFLEASKHMEKMLSDLERRQEVDGDAGQKAAFPEGSSGSMPASAVGLEAMPGTVTGGWDKDMDYLENLLDYGLRFMGNPGGKCSMYLS